MVDVRSALLPLLLLSGSAPAPVQEPLACNVGALSREQRDRYQVLAESLGRALVGSRELSNGFELILDLSRLPADSRGKAFCLGEVAEWIDLEARCCPFLDFGIDVSGKGGAVRLRLTGGENVKAFLKTEFPLLDAKARDILRK
jgi:hypothetical protein